MAAKVIKRNNIAAVIREYEDGEKKNVYKTIGELTAFEADDGSIFTKAELYHMPGVNISVFEQEDRKESF